MVTLAESDGERVGMEALRYINRLSDLLFCRRALRQWHGANDVLWVPGAHR